MSVIASLTRGLHCDIALSVAMRDVTSFRIGGKTPALITVPDEKTLCTLIARMREEGQPFFLIGAGTNLLVSDGGIKETVVRLSASGGLLRAVDETHIVCGAGVPLARLSLAAQEYGMAGLAFCCGIPGSAGGGVYMNAGAYGEEISSVLESATVLLPNGEVVTQNADQLALSYRSSALMTSGGTVLTLTLALQKGDRRAIAAEREELLARRRASQPLDLPSAGSFFKRPKGYYAAKLIDECRLRGYRVGDAQVSDKHAGFVVNRGNATCEQVKRLERDVRTRVYEMTGVTLEPEVRLVGDTWLA